jgi:hypothetical protein
MRAMCLVRIFGIPGGLGNPLGTDCRPSGHD